MISFASSRPAQDDFPVAAFQSTCREVIAGPMATGDSPAWLACRIPPLRHYLLQQARKEGTAGPDDDILITSGCQQALDLLQRVLAPAGTTVAIEDPVYHGQRNVFRRSEIRLAPVPVLEQGVDIEKLARVFAQDTAEACVTDTKLPEPDRNHASTRIA